MTKPSPGSLDGAQRAALFLMVLGEDNASRVLQLMGPKEVQRIGTAMAGLPNVQRDQLELVVNDFSTAVEGQTTISVGNEDYLRKVLVSALGEDRAARLIDRILVGGNSKGLESLKWLDAETVAETIGMEHPQIIAIVVSYLDSDHAAQVLSLLPEHIRGDVIMRVASLESIHPDALHELDEVLTRQFSGVKPSKAPVVGGLKRAADILNFLDNATEDAVLGAIRERDEGLGERIQELMFTFDNLTELDDRGVQRLLRELDNEKLIIALKGATAEIKALIFKNMSKRAGEALQEDLEAHAPVRLSEAEAVQKEILAIVRRLSDEGEIILAGKGGEEYV